MVNYLEFKYGSGKGETPAGKTFNSTLGFQGSDANYTSDLVDGETLTIAEKKATLAWGAPRKGTVKIATTEGTPLTEGTDFTVNYETGAITFTGEQSEVVASYEYDNESVPVKAPTLTMDIKSLPIMTKSRKLTAVWAFDAGIELQKELTRKVA